MKHRTAGSSVSPAREAARTGSRAAAAIRRRPVRSTSLVGADPELTAAAAPVLQVGNWVLREDPVTHALVAVWGPTGVVRTVALPEPETK